MDQSRLANVLGGLPFAALFSSEGLEAVAQMAEHRVAKAGDVLFREGEVHPFFYLVVSGQVILEMCIPARFCSRILTLGPGDIVAWSALLGGGRMTATATCQEPTELIVVDGQKLLALCDTDHDLGYQVMRELASALSRRLLATRLQMLDLFESQESSRGDLR